jgi:phospholipid-transporting ATPase
LDGETNLKNKYVHKDINAKFINSPNNQEMYKMQGRVFCEAPNNAIYKFEGQMIFDGESEIPLGSDNIILRGSTVRNTEHCYALVIFTGHDTKIMMNSMAAKYKFSGLEIYTNYAIAVVLLTQFLLASSGALTGTLWLIKNGMQNKNDNCSHFANSTCERTFYLDNSKELKKGWFYKYMQLTGTWIIIFTNFVPISLLVSLDLVKLYQGFFMSWDVTMYDEEEDMPMRAQAINLNEELG